MITDIAQLRRDKSMADAAGVSPAQIRLLRSQGRLIKFLSGVAEKEYMQKLADQIIVAELPVEEIDYEDH